MAGERGKFNVGSSLNLNEAAGNDSVEWEAATLKIMLVPLFAVETKSYVKMENCMWKFSEW